MFSYSIMIIFILFTHVFTFFSSVMAHLRLTSNLLINKYSCWSIWSISFEFFCNTLYIVLVLITILTKLIHLCALISLSNLYSRKSMALCIFHNLPYWHTNCSSNIFYWFWCSITCVLRCSFSPSNNSTCILWKCKFFILASTCRACLWISSNSFYNLNTFFCRFIIHWLMTCQKWILVSYLFKVASYTSMFLLSIISLTSSSKSSLGWSNKWSLIRNQFWKKIPPITCIRLNLIFLYYFRWIFFKMFVIFCNAIVTQLTKCPLWACVCTTLTFWHNRLFVIWTIKLTFIMYKIRFGKYSNAKTILLTW